MKKALILLTLTAILSGCGTSNIPSSSTTGSETSTPASSSGTSQGSSSTSEGVVSNWPAAQADFVKTYLNGNLPYLEEFNYFNYGDIVSSTKPYINPAVEGASTDYTSKYENLLKSMSYVYQGSDTDSGYTRRIYAKDYFVVTTAYYKGDDNKMWFDVYAYNDTDPLGDYSAYTHSISYTDFPKFSADKQTFTKDVFNVSVTEGGKQNNTIQLRKLTGKIVITSSVSFTELNLEYSTYAYSCFLKAGTSSSNAEIVFNNGGLYKLGKSCNYFEIYTNSANKQTNIYTIYFK